MISVPFSASLSLPVSIFLPFPFSLSVSLICAVLLFFRSTALTLLHRSFIFILISFLLAILFLTTKIMLTQLIKIICDNDNFTPMTSHIIYIYNQFSYLLAIFSTGIIMVLLLATSALFFALLLLVFLIMVRCWVFLVILNRDLIQINWIRI